MNNFVFLSAFAPAFELEKLFKPPAFELLEKLFKPPAFELEKLFKPPAFELEKLFKPPAFELEMLFNCPKQTKQYRCRNIVSYS